MYQVLYRKYRPKSFADVIGQSHITTTLANEIESGKMSHAYLFTGTRGTGKTTCAKILAKAVNCLNPQNGSPCNECEICRGIDDGSILDVLEIDAASNNGVDNIRDIRDESNFSPVNCKFRVYIIDEVHMLSIGAFNALLKTLEEPPAHVKFILATTEVHKLPVTIISRCQRFDFKKVNSQDMIDRMMHIAKSENFELETDAATLISRLSDGGVRDALSLLDQCYGVNQVVTDKIVTQVAGLTGKAHLFKLVDLSNQNSVSDVLQLVSELYMNSLDMQHLCTDLINHYRNLMIVKTVKNCDNLLVCTKEELEQYKEQAKNCSLATILFCIDLFSETLSQIKKGVNARTEIEMAFIKSASPEVSTQITSLVERIEKLEMAIRTGNFSQAAPTSNVDTAASTSQAAAVSQAKPQPTQKAETSSVPQAAPTQTAAQTAPIAPIQSSIEQDEQTINWSKVLEELAKINMPMWGVLGGSTAVIRGSHVLISSTNAAMAGFIKTGTNARDVKEAILRVTGNRYRLGLMNNQDMAQANQSAQEKKPETNLDEFLNKAIGLGINIDQ